MDEVGKKLITSSEKLTEVLNNQSIALSKQIEILNNINVNFKDEHDVLIKLNIVQEALLASIKEHFSDDRENFGNLQKRVERVEIKLSYFAGIGVAIMAFFSLISGWLQNHLGIK